MLNWMGNNTSRTIDRYILGSRIMRGFEPYGIGPRDQSNGESDALGGNYYAVARFDAEFPLGLPEEYGLSGGLFMDVGSVWKLNDTAGAGGPVDDGRHWRAAAGVSLLWDTPIGPLRMNFSRTLRKKDYDRPQNFDVFISSRF